MLLFLNVTSNHGSFKLNAVFEEKQLGCYLADSINAQIVMETYPSSIESLLDME